MNNLLKNNTRAVVILAICLGILATLIAIGSKQLTDSFSLPRVGTPMMDVGSSIKEKEITGQSDLSLSISNTVLNDDALDYSDFIKLYGDKRIQFDDNCGASPSSASFSVGDIFILDNRSSKVQAVKFIDDLYALPPFHVRVFELKRQGIFNIDCGSSKNVAKVIVH
ncbi:MAG: hypothetical protein AAB681_02970 [Patescibacteria group bacterium]